MLARERERGDTMVLYCRTPLLQGGSSCNITLQGLERIIKVLAIRLMNFSARPGGLCCRALVNSLTHTLVRDWCNNRNNQSARALVFQQRCVPLEQGQAC